MNLKELDPDNIPDLHPVGTLQDWTRAANKLFAAGCEAQSFALLASFAAPLMAMMRGEEGGAVLSVWGGKKSGKSVAASAVASVWGAGRFMDGYTGPARYQMLQDSGNLPVIDEGLLSRDPGIVREFMANLTRKQRIRSWQTLMIAFSPASLWEATNDGAPEDAFPYGLEMRVAVPAALMPTEAHEKKHLAYDFEQNAGVAGAAYLKHLASIEVRRWARRQINSRIAEICETYGLEPDSDRMFAMRLIAAVHVAGMMVANQGILEFDPHRITKWATEQAFSKAAPAQ